MLLLTLKPGLCQGAVSNYCGWAAAVAPLHSQPALWSSACRVAGADLIPQRASSESITEKKLILKKKKGTEQQTDREVTEQGTPLGYSSVFAGFIWSEKPYGQLGMKRVVLSAQRGGDIPCWRQLFGLCSRSDRKSALTGGRW